MSTIEHPTSPLKLQPEYLDTPGASALTGLSVRALDTLRYRGVGPRFLRIGRRIRYRIDDLRAWMEREATPAFGPTANRDAGHYEGNHG